MHHRPVLRPAVLAAGLLLAAPLVSGCGFNVSTNEINTISAGVNATEADVDVLGAVVIAAEPGTGVLAATLANNSTTTPDTLLALEETPELSPDEAIAPTEIAAAGVVDLFDTGGIAVSGDFELGQFVPVAMTFDEGGTVALDVPVVTPCWQYSSEALPEIEVPGAEDYECDPPPAVEHGESGEGEE